MPEQVIGNLDVGPTILHAAGLITPDYMEDQLYGMLGESGGMDLPTNQPRGNSQNKR